MLCPENNVSIELEDADHLISTLESYIREQQSLLVKADVTERNVILSQIADARSSLEYAISHRNVISAEEIQKYRSIMQYAIIEDKGLEFSEYHPSIRTIIQQFLQEQLAIDQFLHEADSKLRLMKLVDK